MVHDFSDPDSSSNNNTFEFSLQEIQNQLQTMGITDVSQNALRHFQQDLQGLVRAETSNQSRTSASPSARAITDLSEHDRSSEITLTQELNDDDAVSIVSTSINQSFMSGLSGTSSRSRKRKTVRNGVVTNSQTFDDTISDLDHYKSATGFSKSIDSDDILGNRRHKLAPVHDSSDDFGNLHGTSLYDEKIDDFVKALLEGDETVLDDTHDMSGGLELADNLNRKVRHRSQERPASRDIDVERLPPPPSFMRPSTAPAAGRRVNWHDPVRRHSEYQSYWKTQPKCNKVRDHKRATQIKWQVRNELADLVRSNDERFVQAKEEYGARSSSSRTSVRKSAEYVVPTEKKRQDLRWQIRNVLHDSHM